MECNRVAYNKSLSLHEILYTCGTIKEDIMQARVTNNCGQKYRPTYCTDTMIKAAVETIRKGVSYTATAKLLGLSEGALWNWRKRGEKVIEEQVPEGQEVNESFFPGHDNNSQYAKFAIAIRKAEAESEAALLEKVLRYSEQKGDWRGPMMVLERRFPERWGKSIMREVDHSPEGVTEDTLKIMVSICQGNDELEDGLYDVKALESGE
jgi:hypothetical protein